jgi:hypothetical protein
LTSPVARRLSSSLITIEAVFLMLAVPALICVAYILLEFVLEGVKVCLSGQISAFCMKSWGFPFSDERTRRFQSDLMSIFAVFAFTASVGIVQCGLTAVPLSFYMSQGIAKDARRSWSFYLMAGGLVALSPWALLAIAYRTGSQTIPALFALFIFGAIAGLIMKCLLMRKATRQMQNIDGQT